MSEHNTSQNGVSTSTPNLWTSRKHTCLGCRSLVRFTTHSDPAHKKGRLVCPTCGYVYDQRLWVLKYRKRQQERRAQA